MSQALKSTINIVLFGETAVGKSSIINLIAGRTLVHPTSHRVPKLPFEHERYRVSVDQTRYDIWDATGLSDGLYGLAHPDQAVANLKYLERELSKVDRIDLLLHCVRGPRLRSSWLNNRQIFYSTIFRRQVPIVTIVTGLENHEGEMEDWWRTNEKELPRQMRFAPHACVTTLDANRVDSPALKLRCVQSRQAVLSLIAKTYSHPGRQWSAEQTDWLAAAFQDLRVVISPRKRGRLPPALNVVLYDPALRFDAHEGFTGRLVVVGGIPLNVYRISNQHLTSGRRLNKRVSFVIFNPSISADAQVSRQQLVSFLQSYRGQSRPLLVVVKGAEADEEAQRWWNAGDNQRSEMCVIVTALPPQTSALAMRAATKIRQQIQDILLQAMDGSSAGCFSLLATKRRMSTLRSGGSRPFDDDALTDSVVWIPWFNYW